MATDRLHGRILIARVEAGLASPLLGSFALQTLVPDVGDIGWDQVESMRSMAALRDLRALLTQIETEALTSSASREELVRNIYITYQARLRATIEATREGWRGKFLRKGLPFVVGEVVGIAAGIPVIGGVAGEVVKYAADKVFTAKDHCRWVAADNALRAYVARARAARGNSEGAS